MIRKQKLYLKAKFFKGLADSTRLYILESLTEREKDVSQIVKATNQSQSNVSNHLKCLLECGLVKNRRSGKNVYYSIRDENVKKMLKETNQILFKIYNEIARCKKYET